MKAGLFLKMGVCLVGMVVSLAMAGCDRCGHTHAVIVADFCTGLNQGPYPVEIDPSLINAGVVKEIRSGQGTMDLQQHITINAPIRIVPAEGPFRVLTTQPSTK